MDTQDFNKDLFDYLYGEMTASKKEEFELRLKADKVLQEELDELRSVRNELENLKDKEVMEPFSTWGRSTAPNWFSQKRKVIVFRPVTAVAASLLILFIVGYFTNFSLSISGQGVQLGFGEQFSQIEQKQFSEDDVKAILRQELLKNNEMMLAKLNDSEQSFSSKLTSLESRVTPSEKSNMHAEITRQDLQNFFKNTENKNAETVKEYLKMTSVQQQEYFKAMFTQFNEFYQKQRDDDLMFIQNSLYEVNQNQVIQKQETDKAISSLFTTVNQGGN